MNFLAAFAHLARGSFASNTGGGVSSWTHGDISANMRRISNSPQIGSMMLE